MRLKRLENIACLALLLGAVFVAGRTWLVEHPQHDPWAPLDLGLPRGWATQAKIFALRANAPAFRVVLPHSDAVFTALDPAGEGPCRPGDRVVSAILAMHFAVPMHSTPGPDKLL